MICSNPSPPTPFNLALSTFSIFGNLKYTLYYGSDQRSLPKVNQADSYFSQQVPVVRKLFLDG
jgi:hypothetical protein